MKNLFVIIAAVTVYLLFSIFTGLWAVSWIIFVFLGVYLLVDLIRKNNK